jgi:hypothetical protein
MSSVHAAELLAAAGCFAAGLACSAGAGARFGCGSLANTFLPARAGDVVRLTLFGRVVPGGVFAVAGSLAACEVARWATIVPVGIGAAGSTLPPAALAAPAAALVPIAVAVVLAARGSKRAATMIASLRAAPRSAYLLVIPALELAGTVPLTPANIGVAEGASALAFQCARPAARAPGCSSAVHRSCTASSPSVRPRCRKPSPH